MRFIWTGTRDGDLRRFSKTLTMEAAAKKLGCTKNQVSHRAKLLEIPFRKYGENHHSCTISNEDVFLIRSLRDEGLTYKAIGEKFDTNERVIASICSYKYRNNDNYVSC